MKNILSATFILIALLTQAQHRILVGPTVNYSKSLPDGITISKTRPIGPASLKAKGIQTASLLLINSSLNLKQTVQAIDESGRYSYVEADKKGYGNEVIPNDPIFSTKQYYHLNNGTFNEVSGHSPVIGADMETTLAWDFTTGDTNVILGVFDTGLDLTNNEFSDRLWVNKGEIPNNGIDDDNNGQIDDIHGWDFVNDDNDPTDDQSHGTNVTGIAAATGNNSFGMAGMDWKCKIMVLKVLDSDNSGWYSDWAASLYYAADNGIHVGNMSLSGSGTSTTLENAINYAYTNDALIVVAMGNNDYGDSRYPAAFTNAMAIGATNPDDYRVTKVNTSWGSNYGSHIDCVAPGNRVYSARHDNPTSFTWWKGGTSMATPMVAGLACLLKAQDFSRTADELRDLINNNAEDEVGDPLEDVLGFDNYYGYGRINAYQSLLSGSLLTNTSEVHELIDHPAIYPNPAAQYFKVNEQVGTIITINALDGKVVLETLIDETKSINIKNIHAGLYQVSTISGIQLIEIR